jgi:hypothetical protein
MRWNDKCMPARQGNRPFDPSPLKMYYNSLQVELSLDVIGLGLSASEKPAMVM